MDIDKVRLLSAKQLLDRVKKNGYEQVAMILSDRDVNGEKILELEEFETFRWKLSLSQKKVLFNFINNLKKDPSTILKDDTVTAPKSKYEFSKSTSLNSSHNQIKPALLTPKPQTGYLQDDRNKAAFKQKLGTLFGVPDARPVLPQRPLESNGLSTNIQQKSSDPNVSNDQISGRSEPKPPLPTPVEPRKITRSASPTKTIRRKLPLPGEPTISSQTTTPPRSNFIDNEKTFTNIKPKSLSTLPMETQTSSRSINPTGSKARLPLSTSVEPQTAQRKPALLPPKKLENAPTLSKQKAPNPEEDYVDMSKKDDLNYGYLTPNDIAIARNGSPSLPPRNASPMFQAHGTGEEEEPTYHDPDEVYEPAPSFSNASSIPSTLIRDPPTVSKRGVDSSKSSTEIKSRVVDIQKNDVVERNEEKQGTGFLKKLFRITGNGYENVKIGGNPEHRVTISEKIQPRPLPPLPIDSGSSKMEEISLAEPAGYIELTLHPPEPEELYENYQKGANVLVEQLEESTYINTPVLRRSPHSFPSPFSTINRRSKTSPDDLAAQLAADLKTRIFHNETQSNESDSEMSTEEEEFPEQIYSNELPETNRAFALKSLSQIVNSADEDHKQLRKEPPPNRNNPNVFPLGVDDQEGGIYGNVPNPPPNRNNPNVIPLQSVDDQEGGIYGNVPDPPTNAWTARYPPAPPAQTDVKKRQKSVINYITPQSTPVRRNITREMEKEDNAEQIYGNIEAEQTHPAKSSSQRDSIFNISNEPYYRYTDRKGAKQLLRPLKDGAFLFRPSEKHFLVLTTKLNSKFYNFGIERSQAGKIRLTADSGADNPEFSSLRDFVEYFSKEPLTFQEKTYLAEIYLNPVLPNDAF